MRNSTGNRPTLLTQDSKPNCAVFYVCVSRRISLLKYIMNKITTEKEYNASQVIQRRVTHCLIVTKMGYTK